ncbi:MAG: hypothetical protein ABW005_12955, partial [Burkholderiaceae bacterium]
TRSIVIHVNLTANQSAAPAETGPAAARTPAASPKAGGASFNDLLKTAQASAPAAPAAAAAGPGSPPAAAAPQAV